MAELAASIEGIGVVGPGLCNWPATAAVLTGAAPYQPARTVLPAPEVLPPAERRRAGRTIRLALAVGAEAVAQARRDPRALASVFSSSGGDGDNCHEICLALADQQRLISPTRFHNSVHNAAAGYWSIAHDCTEASVTLCAYDGSFSAALLEAMTQIAQQSSPVLLIAYDTDYPAPIQAHRRIVDAFGVALVLAPVDGRAALATLRVALSPQAPTALTRPELEALRLSSPAARGLPLLEQLAQARTGTVTLDYLEELRLAVEILA